VEVATWLCPGTHNSRTRSRKQLLRSRIASAAEKETNRTDLRFVRPSTISSKSGSKSSLASLRRTIMITIEVRDEETGQVLLSRRFDPNVEKQTERSVTIDGEIDSLLQEVQEVLAQAADLDER
jgi:hypothetical protein